MKKLLSLIILLAMALSAQQVKSDRQVKLEKSLMAPCCYGGAIYDHESAVAFQMKEEIAGMISNGMSDAQILSHYESRYGEKILASPKATGFNLAAWWVPLGIVVISILIFSVYITGLRKRSLPSSAQPAKSPVSTHPKSSAAASNSTDDVSDRVERELNELKKNY